MAFGIKTKEERESEKAANGGNRFFHTSTIDMARGNGVRKFRFLPDLKNRDEPEIPVKAYSMWLPVTINGNLLNGKGEPNKRRVFFDYGTKQDVIPEYMQTKILSRYFMNVFDLTAVIVADTNPDNADEVQLAYPAPDKKYYIGSGKYRKEVTGVAKPNNRIMLLEAPLALMNVLLTLPDVNVDDDGVPLSFLEMTVTASINVGSDGKDAGAASAAQFKGEKTYWDLPRYNLEYFKPYPREAVEALLAGEEYDRVLEEYNIPHTFGKVAVAKDEELPF